ncbi:hypothetical protein [Ilumatobacter sp.]|uniref:hypothetical protein n=1 Tax=Ilumatobacter sp. TaxID=1967498 RepID=UPI003B51EC0A
MIGRAHEPFDDLEVSHVRGRWQIPALTWVTRALLATALAGLLAPGRLGVAVQTAAVGAVVAVPLLRVAWLAHRWRQERDRWFVVFALTLLAVVAVGAVAAGLGAR